MMPRELISVLSENRSLISELWDKQLIIRARSLVEAVGIDEIKSKTEVMPKYLIESLADKEGNSSSLQKINEMLEDLCRKMTTRSITPSETALFVFSLKDAVFPILKEKFNGNALIDAMIEVNRLIDQLGLRTFEVYLSFREQIITDQQRAFREISVPVVKLWHKIIMIPLVGILDSERTQMMMETLLTALEELQAKVAILDISGIPIVDTLVARHLISAASAVRLMGSECIITGIRARIAQTLVQLGVDLGGFTTAMTMADGLQRALELTGQKIV
jgi:rsbT co-antagonist protein RsbR